MARMAASAAWGLGKYGILGTGKEVELYLFVYYMGQWGTMAKRLICNCFALCRSVGQYGGVHVSDPQEQLQWGILPRCVRSPYRELPVSTTGMHSVSTEHFFKN